MAATLKLCSRLSLRHLTQNTQRCCLNTVRQKFLHTSGRQLSLSEDFENAKGRLSGLAEDPGNMVKLKIYALFKQDDAMKEYISVVDSLAGSQSASAPATDTGPESDPMDDVVSEVRDNMHIIRLNRPEKKNAIKFEMYEQIVDYLSIAAKDDTSLAVITGSGDYYCSGNDLSNFTNINPAEIGKMAAEANVVLQRFVGAFIDFPKPLIALINGPAVGVSVTTLGLCDAVYATDRATFQTPFTILGQSAEGCSSYIFPKIMGQAKASEMLFFNKKLNAQEAMDRNLISDILPNDTFQEEAWRKVEAFAKLQKQSMQHSKQLVRSNERDLLHRVNLAECQLLEKLWQSEECITAIMNFFQRKG